MSAHMTGSGLSACSPRLLSHPDWAEPAAAPSGNPPWRARSELVPCPAPRKASPSLCPCEWREGQRVSRAPAVLPLLPSLAVLICIGSPSSLHGLQGSVSESNTTGRLLGLCCAKLCLCRLINSCPGAQGGDTGWRLAGGVSYA